MADVTRIKNRARREEQRENWSRAIELYTQALSESQKKGNSVADLSLYNRIGDIYLRIGQKNTAVRYYEEAIERYAEQELHASAIALCNKVLRIHPARSSVFLQLGRLHLATNLIADATAHYHRYAEAMWELGNEAAAFEGLEELIEQTGDARSVYVWVRWWGLASDREAAEARVEQFRGVVAAFDFDVDELLAKVEAAGTTAAGATVAEPEDESPEPAGAAVASEYDSDEDAPPLPLLDEPPAEPAPAFDIETEDGDPPGVPGQLVEATNAETSGADGGAIPWELEGDEGGHSGWDSDLPEPAAADEWESALDRGDTIDPLPGREYPARAPQPDALELVGPGRLDLEADVTAGPHDGNESSVLQPLQGRESERPAAWYDRPEDRVDLTPPPPYHGGYSTETPEYMASPAETIREDVAGQIDRCEAPVSVCHSRRPEGLGGELAEPPVTWAYLSSGVPPGLDLDSVEAVELALMRRDSAPFRAETGEESVDDEFPLEELVDRVEAPVTEDPGVAGDPLVIDAPPFDREDPIEGAEPGGLPPHDPAAWTSSSLHAEAVEIDPAETPGPLEEAEEGPPTPTHESWSDANEELEFAGTTVDGQADDLASPGPAEWDEAAEPIERQPGADEGDLLESLGAIRSASDKPARLADPVEEAPEPVREEPAATDDQVAPTPAAEPPLSEWDAPPPDLDEMFFDDPITLDRVPLDVEEVAWPEEIADEQSASEPLDEPPASSPTAQPEPEAAPYPESESEAPAYAEPDPEPDVAAEREPEPDAVPVGSEVGVVAAQTPDPNGAQPLVEVPGPSSPIAEPEGLRGAASGIDVSPNLGGEREDAFREWVRTASPQVLRRALTELEVRAELDKALMVVERLADLEPQVPELLQKRLEYASALGDEAAVIETHVSLGQSLERAGRTHEARKAYESLLELDPDHAVAQEAVQRLQDMTDELVEQEEGVALAHPIDSMHGPTTIGTPGTSGYEDLAGGGALHAPDGKPLPYSGVAGGREAAADFEQLLSEFRAELHERPVQSDSMTRTELGASLKEMGRLDDAIRELQAAVREPQAPPMAYELLGEAFLDKGQARVAMRLLRQALQGSEWDERETLGVLYQLGVAYQELGEATNALGCYERIFSVDIDYKDVQERILSCS